MLPKLIRQFECAGNFASLLNEIGQDGEVVGPRQTQGDIEVPVALLSNLNRYTMTESVCSKAFTTMLLGYIQIDI